MRRPTPGRPALRRPTLGVLALVAAVVLGYAGADAMDIAPGVLTFSGPATAHATARPSPVDPLRTPAEPVLPGLSDQAPEPTRDGLRRTLTPLLASRALGTGVSAYVVDAATGSVLLDDGGEVAQAPASTAKLLTAAAALSTVGGGTRLTTTVVQGSSPDEVVLVGGGDMLLGAGASDLDQAVGHAGIATLARQVADALSAAGQTRVAVRLDDTVFGGATVAPTWEGADVSLGLTGRVAAVGLARDRAHLGHPGAVDPAMSAATALSTALATEGIAVAGTPARTTAPDGARVLGQVESATVAEVLGVTLRESDNALAEVLARLTARAVGRPATFPDSAVAVLDQVQRLGIDTGPTRIVDASGLSRGSQVPARVLADVLLLAASPDHPELRPIIESLPVSGFTGTLASRYTKAPSSSAAGVVRAKTGTLTGVSTLAGVTVDDDGRLLVFALMADAVPKGGTLAARRSMDRVGAALTACGCR